MTEEFIKTGKQPSSKLGEIKWLFPEEEQQWKVLNRMRSLAHTNQGCREIPPATRQTGRKENKQLSRDEHGWRGLGERRAHTLLERCKS